MPIFCCYPIGPCLLQFCTNPLPAPCSALLLTCFLVLAPAWLLLSARSCLSGSCSFARLLTPSSDFSLWLWLNLCLRHLVSGPGSQGRAPGASRGTAPPVIIGGTELLQPWGRSGKRAPPGTRGGAQNMLHFCARPCPVMTTERPEKNQPWLQISI